MKFFSVLVVFAAFCIAINFSRISRRSALQTAFVNISKALSFDNHLVTVLFGCDFCNNTDSDSFASISGLPHNVAEFKNDDSIPIQLNSSAIVSLDSVVSAENFNDRLVLPDDFSILRQVFILLQNATFNKIAKIKLSQNAPITQCEYFVIEEKNWLRILTLVWYTPEKCRKAQLVEVNIFNMLTGHWKHNSFKIDKFSNFHGCRINFLIQGGKPEFSAEEVDYEAKIIKNCIGYVCAIVKDFSFSLNYTYHMNYCYGTNILWPELPYEAYMGSVPLYEMQIPENKKGFTRPIYYVEQFFAVPPGEEYDGYEKMVLPFDEDTWMWIAITFASAFITILVLRFVPSGISSFVMGRGDVTPVLNVLRAFFGISQIVCPARNFARYLLMMFIIFSLVIRTAYQGKMFEFLQKEMRKPAAETIEEMIDQNFTFYMKWNFKTHYKDLDFVKRANIVDDWEPNDFYAALIRTYQPGSKTAVFYNRDLSHDLIVIINRYAPPKILKQRFMLEARSLVICKLCFLFDVFDRKLQQYIEADLINYNCRSHKNSNNVKRLEEFRESYAKLTFEELEAGFVVCMLPLVFSIFVFGIEWLLTFKDLIVFLFMFEKYFDVRQCEQERHSELMKSKIASWQARIKSVQERKHRKQVQAIENVSNFEQLE